jgi:hypothetical protein
MHQPVRRLAGFAYARLAAFLFAFGALLIFVCHYYLFPALEAGRHATGPERRLLSAHAALLLAVMLFILLMGLILTFRIGRFFLPRRRQPPRPTVYPDAWSEAGRRLEIDSEDEHV